MSSRPQDGVDRTSLELESQISKCRATIDIRLYRFRNESFFPFVKLLLNILRNVKHISIKKILFQLVLYHYSSTTQKIKISLNLRRGPISKLVPKFVNFSGSCTTFVLNSFGPGVKNQSKFNLRDGGFSKRRNRYISNLKLARFACTGVKIWFNLSCGISTLRPELVIFSGSGRTFVLDSFRPGVKIMINPGDGGLS